MLMLIALAYERLSAISQSRGLGEKIEQTV
jgi:hypothetical protein